MDSRFEPHVRAPGDPLPQLPVVQPKPQPGGGAKATEPPAGGSGPRVPEGVPPPEAAGAARATATVPPVEDVKPPTGSGVTATAEGVEAGLGLEIAAAVGEAIVLLAVQLLLEALKDMLEHEALERDVEARRPEIESRLRALDSKIAAIRPSSDVYARITLDISSRFVAGAYGEGSFSATYSNKSYEGVAVIGVDVADHWQASTMAPGRSDRLSNEASREHDVFAYSVRIDDSFTKARARAHAERVRELAKMQRQKPAVTPAEPAPAPPSFFPSPGAQAPAVPFTPLPGAPGPSSYRQAEAAVEAMRARTSQLLARGGELERRTLTDRSPTPDERTAFARDEKEWRLVVTDMWEAAKDSGQEGPRAALDELLHSERYGGRLAQIVDHLGG
jgi:hypothetical protein